MPQDHERTEYHRGETTRSERSRGERTSAGSRTSAQADVAASNAKAGLRMQKELFDAFQDIYHGWFTRAASQAELALALPNRLTTAQSVPDALAAYRDWLHEWLSLCDEDSRRLMSDSQTIVDHGVRCLATSPIATA